MTDAEENAYLTEVMRVERAKQERLKYQVATGGRVWDWILQEWVTR